MAPLGLWEQILLGVLVVLVLIWFVPGIKTSFARSRKATAADWRALLMPLVALVAFVILLIALAR